MKIQIADSELPIMELLWKKAPQTSPELLEQLEGNPSTQKTLLKRLVDKGMVQAEAVTARAFRYFPVVTQQDYRNATSQSFLDKVFDGSGRAMMMNFIQEERISLQEMEELLDMLKEER